MPNQDTSRFGQVSQRFTALLIAIVLALQSGCVTFPRKPVALGTHYQATLGKVAIVAPSQAPEIKLEGLVRSKGEGALKGAGKAFGTCADMAANGSCSGAICGAAYILWFGVCGVGVVVGSVIGAVATPGSDEVHTAETALSAKTIQEALRGQVVGAASANGASLVSVSPESAQAAAQLRDYQTLAVAGVDTVLEVTLVKVGTVSVTSEGVETGNDGFNPPLFLSMTAHVRLIRTSDNVELFAADYVYLGEKLKLSEWSANQAEPLLHALEVGYKTLGSHIYDNVFLLYPLPEWKAQHAGWLAFAYGLAPTYPRVRGSHVEDDVSFLPSNWTTVDSLRPTLSWQAFPREADIKAAPEEMGRVKNVRYDLVIAREHNLAPVEVVYWREGLRDTRHTLDTSLKPNTRYFWTVRARFEFDGRERVTEWGSTSYWIRGQWTSPSQWSYRFKTRK
jgi:hypothetical protein